MPDAARGKEAISVTGPLEPPTNETAHLLASPANAERLRRSVGQSGARRPVRFQWLWACETHYEIFWGLRIGATLIGVMRSKARAKRARADNA